MDSCVIALRREARGTAPSDWIDVLKEIDDLTVIGAANPNRIQVEASPRTIEIAQELCGDHCHIEPLIKHKPSPSSPYNHRLFASRE